MASCSVLAEKRGLNLPVFGNQVIICACSHAQTRGSPWKWKTEIEKCVLRWIRCICSKDIFFFFCTVMRVRIYASWTTVSPVKQQWHPYSALRYLVKLPCCLLSKYLWRRSRFRPLDLSLPAQAPRLLKLLSSAPHEESGSLRSLCEPTIGWKREKKKKQVATEDWWTVGSVCSPSGPGRPQLRVT